MNSEAAELNSTLSAIIEVPQRRDGRPVGRAALLRRHPFAQSVSELSVVNPSADRAKTFDASIAIGSVSLTTQRATGAA